jgi:hypothetical protein
MIGERLHPRLGGASKELTATPVAPSPLEDSLDLPLCRIPKPATAQRVLTARWAQKAESRRASTHKLVGDEDPSS